MRRSGDRLPEVWRRPTITTVNVTYLLVRHGEGELERRPVVVGASVDTRLVVLSGVNEGDEVVSAGAVLLDGELDRLL